MGTTSYTPPGEVTTSDTGGLQVTRSYMRKNTDGSFTRALELIEDVTPGSPISSVMNKINQDIADGHIDIPSSSVGFKWVDLSSILENEKYIYELDPSLNADIDTINSYFNGLLINADITKTIDVGTGIISLEFDSGYPSTVFHDSAFEIIFIEK